jgi:hypothetical protein
MSADFIARLVGMVVFAGLGIYWGINLGSDGDNQALYATFSAGYLPKLWWRVSSV